MYLNCLITFWTKGKINGPFIRIHNKKVFYGVYRSGIKIKDLQTGMMCLPYLDKKNKSYWNLFNMNTNQLIKNIYNMLIDNIKWENYFTKYGYYIYISIFIIYLFIMTYYK